MPYLVIPRYKPMAFQPCNTTSLADRYPTNDMAPFGAQEDMNKTLQPTTHRRNGHEVTSEENLENALTI